MEDKFRPGMFPSRKAAKFTFVPTWIVDGHGKQHIVHFMPLCPIEKGYIVMIDGEEKDRYSRQPSLKAVKELIAKHCPGFAK